MPGIDINEAIADARAPASPTTAAPDVAGAIADARSAAGQRDPTKITPEGTAALEKLRTGPSRTERFKQGLGDLEVGLGQLTSHILPDAANKAMSGKTTAEFDDLVAGRERLYQQQRENAAQNGIDWWRMGGEAANPLNFVAPGGAMTVGGRIAAGTAAGAAFGALQPSTHPGDFWADKAKGTAIGAATGAVASAAFEGAARAVGAGVTWARGALGGKPSAEASHSVADAIAKGAAENQGIDPKTLDLDVLGALRKEAQETLDKGVKPSETVIFNRAVANSLPVPVPLTRPWAAKDAIGWGDQFRLKGVKGAGGDIIAAEQQANAALIANLDAIGAAKAPDVVSAGQTLTGHLKQLDEGFQSRITQAYDAVRNSLGQPAALDGKTAVDAVRANLDDAQLTAFLPKEIASTLDDIASGKLPLNVKTAQALDKAWTGLQSGKSNYGLSTSADNAIQRAKAALLDAPVMDASGEASIEAYKVAKGLAKRRFDLIDANPAFKAVVNEARDAEPEKFFRKFVMGSTAREAKGLRELVTKIDPKADELIGRTILGEIKDKTVANGTAFSAAKFDKFLDPVWKSRLNVLLPEGAVGTLEKLGYVANLTQVQPVGASVNRSGTAAALVNFAATAAKTGAMQKLSSVLSRYPVLAGTFESMAGARAAAGTQQEVSQLLNPGVTSAALPGISRATAKAASITNRAVIPAALRGEKDLEQ